MSVLLDPAFLKKLERVQLLSLRLQSRAPSAPGERQSRSRGRSVEFAEHRDYQPGDDLRHLDWNAYARMDKLFLKLFVEEREQTVTILLDGSASMSEKTLFSRQLAAALAYISLASYDRVALGFVSDRLVDYLPPVRGRRQLTRVLEFLARFECRGTTDLDAALPDYGRRHRRPGMVVVLSDFFQESAGIEGLKRLRFSKNEVHAIQVLSPSELDPELRGDLKLVDVETGEGRELTMTGSVLEAYRQALESHSLLLAEECRRYGCGFLRSRSDADLERLVLDTLRRNRLLR